MSVTVVRLPDGNWGLRRCIAPGCCYIYTAFGTYEEAIAYLQGWQDGRHSLREAE